MVESHRYMYAPPLLNVAVTFTTVLPDLNINIEVNGTAMLYCLSGIVYYGNRHFTARFIELDGSVWFNNGIVQARGAHREGMIINVNLMQDVSGKT
ncbi:hypothetical protein ARMGADRAFT_930353 [Armillaria gallica]|uniref:Uncharacterized protein n=1 Tax=Armillaria gallica TaxID=47427 RepID=A0A2H3DBG6_ARMGA|nr:hypothetical protein ARMGADRAFT_930353 [Armillaria gallica]